MGVEPSPIELSPSFGFQPERRLSIGIRRGRDEERVENFNEFQWV
jgi:hypothetical protein